MLPRGMTRVGVLGCDLRRGEKSPSGLRSIVFLSFCLSFATAQADGGKWRKMATEGGRRRQMAAEGGSILLSSSNPSALSFPPLLLRFTPSFRICPPALPLLTLSILPLLLRFSFNAFNLCHQDIHSIPLRAQASSSSFLFPSSSSVK